MCTFYLLKLTEDKEGRKEERRIVVGLHAKATFCLFPMFSERPPYYNLAGITL